MTKFFDYIIYSNLLISVCPPLLFLMYAFKTKQSFSLSTPFLLFLGTFVAYNLLRQSKLFSRFTLFSTLLVAAVLGVLELKHNPQIDMFFFSLILCLIYEQKKLNFGLRRIPFLKNFIVALVWAALCTGLFPKVSGIIFFDCFSFIFLLTLVFDYKDKHEDKEQKILTWARLIPAQNYKVMVLTLYSLYLIFIAVVFNEFFFLSSIAILVIVLNTNDLRKSSFHLLVDGLIILRCLLYFC